MIDLSLTVEDINIILGGLGELPAKVSMKLIVKIQEQAQPQIEEPTEE